MLDDKPRKLGLLDQLLSPTQVNSAPQTNDESSLLPTEDELIKKLRSLQPEELEDGVTPTFDSNGTMAYNLVFPNSIKPTTFNANPDKRSPIQDVTASSDNTSRAKTSLETKSNREFFKTDKGFNTKIRQNMAEQVREIGKQGKLVSAINQGLYGAAKQNIEMNTGLDINEAGSAYKLSYEELNDLLNHGYITLEEHDKYLKSRNQLPLLTAIVASLGNSLLLAGEIGATAPKTAVEFTAAGVKFFSKEGLKRYGKEMVTQGVNSYRVMGLGANIRATRESIKEIEDKNITDVDDILLTMGKHYVKENVSAFAEGMSESMIRTLKYADVPIVRLMLGDKKAWLTLASNLGRKSINGLLFETATEQVTDLISDITSGNNVFTQGSNFINIFTGETDQVRRAALENAFIEATTGSALGVAFGGKEVFRRSIEDKIQDKIDKGEITKEEAEAIIEAAQENAAINNALKSIQKKNEKATWNGSTKSVAHGLNVFQSFGTKNNVVANNVDDQTHKRAIEMADNQLPLILKNTAERVEEEEKRTGLKANTLDQAIIMGQERALAYLDARGKIENINLVDSFVKDDATLNLPFEILHSITEDAKANISATGAAKGITSKLYLPEGLPFKQAQELQEDLMLAAMTGFETPGFEALSAKWSKVLPKAELERALDSAKLQQTEANKTLGSKSLSAAFENNMKNVQDYFGQKALEEMDNRSPELERERDEIDSIGEAASEILNQDTGWRPKAVALRDEKGTIIEGKPGMNHIDIYGKIPGVDEYNHTYEQGFVDYDGNYMTREQVRQKAGVEPESVTLGLAGNKAQWKFDPSLGFAVLDQMPDERPLDFKEVLSRSPLASAILRKIGDNDSIFLTGSLALAAKGTIIRDASKPIHDLDFRTTLNREQIASYMAKNFPNAGLANEFGEGDNKVIQYVVFENQDKLVRDKNGRLIGIKAQGSVRKNNSVDSLTDNRAGKAGRVITVDFFLDPRVAHTPFVYNLPEGGTNTIQITSPSDVFKGKDRIRGGTRPKDIKDKKDYFGNGGLLFQRPEAKTQKPINSDTMFPSYADKLAGFNGKTAGELFVFMKENGLIQESLIPVIKILSKFVSDIEVQFDERVNDKGQPIPGGYKPATDESKGIILINKNAVAYNPFDTGNTVLHEALHAFTVDFLRSNTKEALEFRSDIDAVIRDLKDVLNNPEKAIKNGTWTTDPNQLRILIKDYAKHIEYYTKDAEEFIAGVFSDTTKVRGMLMRIKATAQLPTAKVTLWDKVRNAFKTAWGQQLPNSESTLFDSVIDAMSKNQANIEAFHKERVKAAGLTTQEVKTLKDIMSNFHSGERGIYPENIPQEEDIEKNQEDDESLEDRLLDAASTKGFVSLLSKLVNVDVPEMRKRIKNMGSRDAFKVWLDQQDMKFRGAITKRLEELYETSYKKKQEDPTRFKDRFITGTFNSIINSKSMPHIMVRTDRVWNPVTRRQDITTSIVKLGDTFKNGDGSTQDSYVGEVILESFIGPLETFLGLNKGSLQLQYIAGFESYRDKKFEQRSTLSRLTNWILGKKDSKQPKSKELALSMSKEGYLYMGNFGGRNTSPVFFVPVQERVKVAELLGKVAKQYGIESTTEDRYGQALRLLLEDMWAGAKLESLDKIGENSKVLKDNINKVWKRGMKFLTKVNRTWENAEHLKKIIGNKPLHGIAIKNGDITLRTAIFSSNDTGNITVRAGNESVTVPISALLRNSTKQETERTDGASFYLLGELDEIYAEVFGTLKDGTIKNVYSSEYGETPLYIKHAMHGVHPKSALGTFMRQHNIALLVSDTAAKIPATTPINISEFQSAAGSLTQTGTIPAKQIMELKLSKFQRIKEELGTNSLGGTIKQWLNGSGHGTYSSVIKQSDFDGQYDAHLQELSRRITKVAQEELLKKATPKALFDSLKSIVDSPSSPREEIISKAFKPILQLSQSDFINNFGNVFNFPMVAEALRQKLYSTLATSLQGRIAGMRLTLRFDGGLLNTPAGYDLIASKDNLDRLLVSFALDENDSTVKMSEVFPETGLGELAKRFLELQRLESIANNKHNSKLVKEIKAQKEQVLNDIQAIGEADTTTEARKEVFRKSGGNIYRLIDQSNIKNQLWKQKRLDKIVDPTFKTLTEDWSVIPEDLANAQGLKVGDKFILNVTPTDSPLGIIAGRVAAIAPVYKGKDGSRKVADRMSIMMNSEYIQSIVGKDFDIDTISAVTYDPDFWTREQFEAVWQTIKSARSKFVLEVRDTMREVLQDDNISAEDAFTGEVREKYMQAVMGASNADSFNATDTFWELNDAYLVDPSGIITERLYHTALSAINLRSKINGVSLKVNHPGWFKTHLAHLIDTNFSVDFPGQLSKLKYTGESSGNIYREQLFALRYGNKPNSINDTIVTDKILRFLFGTAFDLAAGRDLSVGTKPDFYRLKEQIKKQQAILILLSNLDSPFEGNDLGEDAESNLPVQNKRAMGRTLLADIILKQFDKDLEAIEKIYGNTHKAYQDAYAQTIINKEIALQFIANLQVDDVSRYPLFTSIMNIDTNNLPMPGSTYYDWLIDQNLLASELLNANAKLYQIFHEQILGEATSYKKSFFVQEKTFINSLAWNIIKFAGIPKGTKTPMELMDSIIANSQAIRQVYNHVGEQNVGKLRNMLVEYSALRSLVGQPYPVDAIRGGQNWDITHQSIALSLLPKQLDFTAGRNQLQLDTNLQGVQSEIIAILNAFEEPVTTGTFVSDQLLKNWHGRQVSFPMLMKLIMSSPKIGTKDIPSISLKWGDKTVSVHTNSQQQLVFKVGEASYTHQDLVKASEGEGAELYKALTERNGIFEGAKLGSQGISNRAELSKLINFSDNTKPEDRMALLEQHIQKRLYSSENKFSNTERQGLWISFFAQATDAAIRDNKLQGMNIRREIFDDRDAMNYRSNEVLYQLLARFEPQLFNRAMAAYSEVTSSKSRIDTEVGIQASRKSSLAVGEILNQPAFDEGDARQRNDKVFSLLKEELHTLEETSSYSDLKKAIKANGFTGGISYLRNLINNTQIKYALSSSDIWFGDLVYDIKKLSPAKFTEKYGPNGAQKIHDIIKQQATSLNDTETFLNERVVTQGNDIAALKAVFFQLKAMEKLSNKVDSKLNSRWKKMLYGKLSYNLVAPIKEKKVHAFKSKDSIIGQMFSYDGVKDLKVSDMESFNKSYNTNLYDGVGESSISMKKSQEINMALNRYHAELGGEISAMENLFQLILDPDKRKTFMAQEATSENVERVELLKKILPELDKTDTNILLLRKEIFLLAENLKSKTNIEVGVTDIGQVVYRRGTVYNFNKYKFLEEIVEPRQGFDDEGNLQTEVAPFTPLEKIKLLAALDIRELYDVKVPDLLRKALGYIERTRTELSATQDLETIIELDAIRDRYTEYLIAIVKKTGVYMPHLFATETYKFLWANKYRNYIVEKLKAENPHMNYDSKEFGEMIIKAIDSAYGEVLVGDASTYTMPNFLPRRNPEDDSYKKATLDMHYQYVGQLISGLKHDLLYTDWLLYRHRARANGERTIMLELTRMWYADQMRNKMMHTKDVDVNDITPGMQINFLQKGFTFNPDNMLPYEGDLQVWGKVEKVNKKEGTITLKVDRARIRFDTTNDLNKAKNIRAGMSEFYGDQPASNKQIFHIKSLIKKGFIKLGPNPIPLSDLTVRQALDLNIAGLTNLLANIDKLGVYKISDLYSKDINGKNQPKVNRYTRRGALEYLGTKRREADNLRNTIGEFDNTVDKAAYAMWTGAVWAGNLISTVPKTIMAMLTMGMITAPNAFMTNWHGALIANHADAPYTNFWKYRREGKAEWAGFKKKSRDAMNASQRQWYDLFTSLGLASNKDLVAISLEAGNISMMDVLSDKGFFGGLTYLAAAIKSGGEYHSYLQKMDDFRRKYLIADTQQERSRLENKMKLETDLWRNKIEKRIKSYAEATTPTEAEINVQRKLNPKASLATVTEYARTKKIIDINKAAEEARAAEKAAGTYKEVANVAVEEQMDRKASAITLGKFLGKNFVTGYLGLGLQALAEVQRRPAFYIGFRTALDMGYSREEALTYGVASVEYRHAFYGPSYRQFDANTKLGAFLQQYVQYTWNNFIKWFFNIKQALPQILQQWERGKAGNKSFPTRVWNMIFSRKFTALNELGEPQKSRNKDSKTDVLSDVNILHRLAAKGMLSMMINQAGSRLFYGLTGWTDPMVQLFYKFTDLFTDKMVPTDDDDDDETAWETLAMIGEAFFFLGLPYKLLMQYAIKQPDEDIADVYWRGRLEDQTEFIERASNEIRIINGELDPSDLRSTNEKRFYDLNWLIDDLALGVKVVGYAYPDSDDETYTKWGLYPSFNGTPPFLHFERESREIHIKNRARYINTEGEGINFGNRMNRAIIEAHKTWLPFVDKLSSDYKPTK